MALSYHQSNSYNISIETPKVNSLKLLVSLVYKPERRRGRGGGGGEDMNLLVLFLKAPLSAGGYKQEEAKHAAFFLKLWKKKGGFGRKGSERVKLLPPESKIWKQGQ